MGTERKNAGFAAILKNLEDGRNGRLKAKVPDWAGVSPVIPSDLCLEQCSSQATALYKASVLEKALEGHCACMADLTGGLGVDSWAFSKIVDKVLYFERNTALCAAARTNFAKLGCTGITCYNQESSAQSIESLPELDAIFIDPARRNGTGSKVFLLEDCTPNVLELLPQMASKARIIMLKLSPMADITMVVRQLEEASQLHVSEVHVVSSRAEVKELLVLLGHGRQDWRIHIEDDGRGFDFTPTEEAQAQFVTAGEIRPGMILLEPRPALLKAGCFKLPCSRFAVAGLGRDCHLYLADTPTFGSLFKQYDIIECLPMGNAAVREVAGRYPVAEVTAKGLKMSSEELRRRIGCKSGIAGDGRHYHIFGCDTASGRWLLVCAGRAQLQR